MSDELKKKRTISKKMPKDLNNKCHAIIHPAALAAGAAGAIPIPVADAIPITAIQAGMIIGIGKLFGHTLGEGAAAAIIGAGGAVVVGKNIFRSAIKLIPGVGWGIAATTAFIMTESLGWLVADDFYQLSIGGKTKFLDALKIVAPVPKVKI